MQHAHLISRMFFIAAQPKVLGAARSAWQPVNLHCFQFIGKAQAYLHDTDVSTRKMILRWTIALPYLLRSHLLNYKPGCDELDKLLTPAEVCSHVACAQPAGIMDDHADQTDQTVINTVMIASSIQRLSSDKF